MAKKKRVIKRRGKQVGCGTHPPDFLDYWAGEAERKGYLVDIYNDRYEAFLAIDSEVDEDSPEEGDGCRDFRD